MKTNEDEHYIQVCLLCKRWKDSDESIWHPSSTMTTKPVVLSHGYCPLCAAKVRAQNTNRLSKKKSSTNKEQKNV